MSLYYFLFYIQYEFAIFFNKQPSEIVKYLYFIML